MAASLPSLATELVVNTRDWPQLHSSQQLVPVFSFSKTQQYSVRTSASNEGYPMVSNHGEGPY